MQSSILISKADQLLNSTIPQERTQLQAQFTDLISNVDNLQLCLQTIPQSNSFLFIFMQVLAKALQKGKYLDLQHLIESRFNATDPDLKQGFTKTINDRKNFVYGSIVSTMVRFFDVPNLSSHTRNQCINVISLCMKCLCQSIDDHTLFSEIIIGLFPGFVIDKTMTNSHLLETSFVVVNPNTCYIPNNFYTSCKIILSLIEYVQISSYYKSYYQYRRSVYNFKAQFTTYLVQLAVYYLKTLVIKGDIRSENMTVILQIFQQIVCFPYSLNIHQYETEEDVREVSRGEIYYPPIMKLVLSDNDVFQFFGLIYEQNNSTQNYELVKKDLLLILKILSRFFATNSYYFDNQPQKQHFRKRAVVISMNILNKLFFINQRFIVAVLEILTRIIGLYSVRDYGEHFAAFTFQVINFCKLVMNKCSIVVDSEPSNPFLIMFNILTELNSQAESDPNKLAIYPQFKPKQQIQNILEQFFSRITKEYDIRYEGELDWEKQIQSFTHFYSTIYDAFRLNQSQHLTSFLNLDFTTLSPLSLQFWVYFICTLVNQNNFFQTYSKPKLLLIHKVFMATKELEYLSVFKFIDLITTKFLEQSSNTRTEIWNSYQQHSNVSFEQFTTFIIKKLIATIYSNDKIFMYVIKILNKIYVHLKKINPENMKTYSPLLNDLIVNLEKTLFANPNFYDMRVDLFQLISIIWIEQNCYNKQGMEKIYSVFEKVSQNAPNNIVVYLFDARGLLKPIDSPQPYKIVCELIIRDISKISEDPAKVEELMSNEIARKAMTKLAQEITSDQFSRIKYKEHRYLANNIEKTFGPFLKKAAEYPYGRSLLKAYNNFINLTPIKQALALPRKQNCVKPFLEYQVNILINNYFQNIHKVADIDSLYPYICDNGDFLHFWCEEIIARQIHVEPSKLRAIVESKCWKDSRMIEMVTKSLWIMGSYDQRYKVIPGLWEDLRGNERGDDLEEEFEKRFAKYVAE